MHEIAEPAQEGDRNNYSIAVVGIGGCGNNAVTHMINRGLAGPNFVAVNSDLQDLHRCLAPQKVQIGVKSAGGRGCGGDPARGRLAAEEDLDVLKKRLAGAEIVFVAAGLGGGTGTGGAPVVAEALSRLEEPPVVVGVVTLPFNHERSRQALASKALAELVKHCSCVIPVPNSKLYQVNPRGTLLECRAMADDVLLRAVASLTEVMERPGVFGNLDLNDVRAAFKHRGQAIMGYGQATGERRALKALKQAIESPLLADISIRGARSIMVIITCDSNLKLEELLAVNEELVALASTDVELFAGVAEDESLAQTGTIKVTVLASGLISSAEEEPIDLVIEPEPAILVASESLADDETGLDLGAIVEGVPLTGEVAASQDAALEFELDEEFGELEEDLAEGLEEELEDGLEEELEGGLEEELEEEPPPPPPPPLRVVKLLDCGQGLQGRKLSIVKR
jgi:cell division protein FtsZ